MYGKQSVALCHILSHRVAKCHIMAWPICLCYQTIAPSFWISLLRQWATISLKDSHHHLIIIIIIIIINNIIITVIMMIIRWADQWKDHRRATGLVDEQIRLESGGEASLRRQDQVQHDQDDGHDHDDGHYHETIIIIIMVRVMIIVMSWDHEMKTKDKRGSGLITIDQNKDQSWRGQNIYLHCSLCMLDWLGDLQSGLFIKVLS